ncbi:hypothetical protein WJ0W_006896 [Paenibacillus melissococcoides]|uniref:Uncharacterized protein n=1 Tax=Paenibacillus melissococcoides TaxID=2912268 RepID=A0ABM9GEH3_9BACL|nr:hypothetical protein [Paenibacillus melissococcoides]CAH8249712.1 hypothetical protein WJ0W_006896 [Paenibacillus melissococcoides]
MYVVEASIERRVPDVIIDDAIEMSKRFRRDYKRPFRKFGVETVQFQALLQGCTGTEERRQGWRIPADRGDPKSPAQGTADRVASAIC